MQFVIIGGGAIGGSFAAHLLRARHEVLVVETDPAHVRAMRDDGLTLEGREEFKVGPVLAARPDEVPQALKGKAVEVAVLAVKSQHSRAALPPVLPYLAPQGIVLSMQNGLNPHTVAEIAGRERTLAAAINQMATDYLAPGRIMFGGPGTIHIGELDGTMSARLEQITRIVRETYVANTAATDNVLGYLWGKVAFGAMLFATALSDDFVADTFSDPRNLLMLGNLSAEVIAVAEAEKVRCQPFDGYEPGVMRFSPQRDWAAIAASLNVVADSYRVSKKPRSGIWRDIKVRRRESEADGEFGPVIERARRHGLALPLLTRLVALIHELEEGKRAMGGENLQELREVAASAYRQPG